MAVEVFRSSIASPLGAVTISSDGAVITALTWGKHSSANDRTPLLDEAGQQLTDFFAAKRQDFDLPLGGYISDFAARFGQALIDIPFGETRTYGDLAKDLDVSAQAIGQACGANRIPIIIPCHRVLGANGLGGFSGSGGVEDKIWLLKHEGSAGLLI